MPYSYYTHTITYITIKVCYEVSSQIWWKLKNAKMHHDIIMDCLTYTNKQKNRNCMVIIVVVLLF